MAGDLKAPTAAVGSQTLWEPPTVSDAADLVRALSTQRRPFLPCGNRTLVSHLIDPGFSGPVHISTRAMSAAEDFSHGNLSLQVQAGMTLNQVQYLAGTVNAFLPVDAASHGDRTIGSLLAEGVAGIEAYHFGSFKEYILGVHMITPGGDVVKTGGQTVKNVAGYDFTRLLWGSFGTLGMATSVTLRLVPQLEKRLTLVYDLDDLPSCARQAKTIMAARLCLLTLKALGRSGAGSRNPWQLAVGLGGSVEAVEDHAQRLCDLTPTYPVRSLDATTAAAFWKDHYRQWPDTLYHRRRAAGDRRDLYALVRATASRVTAAKEYQMEIDFGWPQWALRLETAAQTARFMRSLEQALPQGARFQIERGPGAANIVYERIKNALDPGHLMGLSSAGESLFP